MRLKILRLVQEWYSQVYFDVGFKLGFVFFCSVSWTCLLWQGWAWDGTASPKDFCSRDLSPKAQNPGTVPTIFVPVSRVPGLCVPWNDFGTARILGTAWDSSPRNSPGILDFFFEKTWFTRALSEIRQNKVPQFTFIRIGTSKIGTSPNWHFPQFALASGLNTPTAGSRSWPIFRIFLFAIIQTLRNLE